MSLSFTPQYDFVAGLGHLPGLPRFSMPIVAEPLPGAAPPKFSILEVFPERFAQTRQNQRQTSSCTGQLAKSIAQDRHVKATGKWAEMSALFPYNRGRSRRGWLNQDGGAIISDVFDVLEQEGIPLNAWMPFDEQFLFQEPLPDAILQAARHKLVTSVVPRSEKIIQSILSGGGDPAKAAPVGIGIIVYQHRLFAPEVVKSGFVDFPSKTSDFAGWHAIKLIGYDTAQDTYDWENWWGESWASQSVVGKPGFGKLAGQYLRDSRTSSDFVTAESYTASGDES